MSGEERPPESAGAAAGRAAAQAGRRLAAGAVKKGIKKGAQKAGKELGKTLGRQAAAGTATGGTSVAAELAWRMGKPLIKWALLLALVLIILVFFVIVGSMAAVAGEGKGPEASTTCAVEDDAVPGELAPIYDAAAQRFGLGERGAVMLAAINHTETTFGKNAVRSSAGALGPMQFLPSTWAKGHANTELHVVVAPTASDGDGYATDGNEDGVADIENAPDAIHAAARLLKANGAPKDWHAAVYGYNHSEEYVDKVTTYADGLKGTCTSYAMDAPMVPGQQARLLPDGTAAAPADAPDAVKRMIAAANHIAHRPYVYGAGHGGGTPYESDAYDCSSAVSYVLHAGGLLKSIMVSGALMSWGLPVGQAEASWVVVYANDGHTFMSIAGLAFDNYGSRGSRSMWTGKIVEKVNKYVARVPSGGVA